MANEWKFAKDVIIVMLGNVLVAFSSILTGLVIPKLMGVTNYGYYKIFTLYMTYAVLLHFGFVDGILLFYGGENYEELNKKKIRFTTRFFVLFQSTISALLVLFGMAIFNGIYRYIVIMLAIDMSLVNITTYYQFISQCTMRFKELSIRRVLQAFLKMFVVIGLYILHKIGIIDLVNSYIYIFSIVAIDSILLLWYVYTYSDITFGQAEKFRENRKLLVKYFKLGIVVTFAYQVANLILSLDRQFVSVLFGTDTYSVYSFAYSLVTIITTILTTISTVLFPNLKRKKVDEIITAYPESIGIVSFITFASMVGYYPLCSFIKWFLPDYVASLQYFRLLFPGIAISSCITVVTFNYYKVLNKTHIYFGISSVVLLLSAILNWGAYYIFKTPTAITVASIITLIIWYVLSQLYFIKEFQMAWKKDLFYIFLMAGGFYFIVYSFDNELLGFVSYFVIYLIVTLVFYKKTLTKNLRNFLVC